MVGWKNRKGGYQKPWYLTIIWLLEFVHHPACHKQHSVSEPIAVSRLKRKGSDAYAPFTWKSSVLASKHNTILTNNMIY